MKKWTKPEMTQVDLEPEEDVLSYCYGASTSPTNTGHKCATGLCFSNTGP